MSCRKYRNSLVLIFPKIITFHSYDKRVALALYLGTLLHPNPNILPHSPLCCGTGSHLSTPRRGKGKHKYPCIPYRICPSFGVILHLLGGSLPKDCSTEQYEGGKVTYSGRRVNQYWSDAEPVVVRAATTTGRMSDHYWLHSPPKSSAPEGGPSGALLIYRYRTYSLGRISPRMAAVAPHSSLK